MVRETLTDYERRRLENIRRNDEMMASLMLQRKASDLSAAYVKRPSPKSSPSPALKRAKSHQSEAPVVIRRSLRHRGIPPDSSLHHDSSDEAPPTAVPSPPSPSPARKREAIRLQEAYVGTPDFDREFVDVVVSMEDDAPLGKRSEVVGGEDWDPREELGLRPENVKRFLPGRILSVRFFPFSDRSVIAAGDKYGNLGFWDVDYGEGEGDGVYIYAPHSAPVSGISIQPSSLSKIFTSSYDGLIRLMDAQKETFDVIYSSNDAIYSISQQLHVGSSVYFGEGSGCLKVCDASAGKVSNSWTLHDSRINTIDFNPVNTNLMVTSSTDGTACIWDLRSIKNKRPAKLKTIQHKKAVHSAFFSPSGGSLVTTSPDNHVGIVSGVDFNDISMVSHDNWTGRWISTFRAIWGWDDTYLFLGNMKRAIDVISSNMKTMVALESPLMTAIPARFAAHPYKLGSLAGATAGGQVYLWTI